VNAISEGNSFKFVALNYGYLDLYAETIQGFTWILLCL